MICFAEAHHHIYHHITNHLGLFPLIGAEVEFYLSSPPNPHITNHLVSHLRQKNIAVSELKEEKGHQQFEFSIEAHPNSITLANHLISLRKEVNHITKQYRIMADFSAMPHRNQPANAMHMHISLWNHQGKNVFVRPHNFLESATLHACIAGLLELMPASCQYFCTDETSYDRFHPECHQMFSPSTISWGSNNRTVALRLPSTPLDPENRRIEHRIPTADANPHAILTCILAACFYGIKRQLSPTIPKTYGNAFHPQYQLSSLPASFQEASAISHPYLSSLLQRYTRVF